MPFNVGENVGPYRIVQQLGHGGMATVYKAFHAALERYVALKVLHPAFGEDPNFEARFRREARLVARLEHPHIVPIYDYAEHEGRPYLVMKYIQGDTLKARLRRGPLTSAEILNVVESVGSALAYAHGQGVLHRDIKPSNVLIGADGVMWLADFGLARIAQSAESTLSSDMIMGTPQYISPEQAMGMKQLDEGTDIYSFGVMLYELVVGQVPFNADTPFSIIHDHIYRSLPAPRTINPGVPEPVERVLLKALAKDRTARYADVNSLVRDFKAAWAEAGVPMRGTELTMPPAALQSEPRTTPPAAARVARPSTPRPLAQTNTAPRPAAEARPHAEDSAGIWFLVGGAAVLICVAVVTLAGLRFLRDRQANIDQATSASLTAAVPTAAPVQSFSTDTPAATTTETAVPAVATAFSAAQLNPTDPQSQLQLSLAYWDAGLFRPSFTTLQNAAGLAGRTNTQFFQSAGDQFRQRHAWIAATAMYARAIKSLNPSALPSDALRQSFHQSLYNAANQADFTTYLSFSDLSVIEKPIVMVAEARNDYYNGDTSKGHATLNEVLVIQPHMAEASLLQAEMDANEGKTFEAKQILNILLADLATPDWVREFAQSLSNKIP